jgi:hypothetical protein
VLSSAAIPRELAPLRPEHYCATRRSGSGFVLGRKPVRKRMCAKLREIKEQLMAMRHEGTERQDRWLRQVLRGAGWHAVHERGWDAANAPGSHLGW